MGRDAPERRTGEAGDPLGPVRSRAGELLSLPFLTFTTCEGREIDTLTGWEAMTTEFVPQGGGVLQSSPREDLVAVLVVAVLGAVVSPFWRSVGRVLGTVLGLVGAYLVLVAAGSAGDAAIGGVLALGFFLIAAGWGAYRLVTRPKGQTRAATQNGTPPPRTKPPPE